MARSSHEVKVRLTAEDEASGKIDRLGKSMKTGLLAAAAAVTAAFYAVGKVFSATTKAAAAQEDAVIKLDAALASLGPNAAIVSKALQEQAAALQKVTKYGDETIIAGQALIASFTKDEEAIKSATKAAIDLSAATGQSLPSAFLLLGKAAKGETSTLSRYGIVLDEGLSKSEKFAAAIAAINDQWGGQAAAQAKTYSGLIQQIGNAWGDLLETLGFAFTKNEKLLEILTKVRDLLTSGGLVDAISGAASALAQYTSNTIDAVVAIKNLAVGLQEVDRYYQDILGITVKVATAEEKANAATERRVALLNQLTGGLYTALKPLIDLGNASTELGNAEAALTAQNDLLAASFQKQVEELLKVETAASRAKEQFDELIDTQNEEIDASDSFIASLQKIGVVLESDVSAAMEENNRLLREADELYKRGEITRRDFEKIELAVAAANDDATQSFIDQNTVLVESAGSFSDAASAADSYASSVANARGEVEAFAAATASGSSLGGTLSGGSKLFPNSAIANTAIRNGVAVDVRGQGFRN